MEYRWDRHEVIQIGEPHFSDSEEDEETDKDYPDEEMDGGRTDDDDSDIDLDDHGPFESAADAVVHGIRMAQAASSMRGGHDPEEIADTFLAGLIRAGGVRRQMPEFVVHASSRSRRPPGEVFHIDGTVVEPRGDPISACEVMEMQYRRPSGKCAECDAEDAARHFDHEQCAVCLEKLSSSPSSSGTGWVVKMPSHDHFFHYACINEYFESHRKRNNGSNTYQCPVCRQDGVTLRGAQPDGVGSMRSEVQFDEDGKAYWHTVFTFSCGDDDDFKGAQDELCESSIYELCLPFTDPGTEMLSRVRCAWDRHLLFRVEQGKMVPNGIDLMDNPSERDPLYVAYLDRKLKSLAIP